MIYKKISRTFFGARSNIYEEAFSQKKSLAESSIIDVWQSPMFDTLWASYIHFQSKIFLMIKWLFHFRVTIYAFGAESTSTFVEIINEKKLLCFL